MTKPPKKPSLRQLLRRAVRERNEAIAHNHRLMRKLCRVQRHLHTAADLLR